MMPKMDGFALTQAIRDGGSMMPILMLTAKALPCLLYTSRCV